MKIIPKTMLKVDQKKPAYMAGKVCDIKKELAEDLIARGLGTLPVVVKRADQDPVDQDPVDDNAGGQVTGD